MFRIKICGITNIGDAMAAAEAGADAIGLNFYPKSARCVNRDDAATILQAAPAGLFRVGVVVNETVADLHQLMTELRSTASIGLQAVQLHGDEPPHYVGQVRANCVIRARRLGEQGIAQIAADLEACDRMRRLPDAVLVDAAAAGQYGGSGTTVSWSGLADYRRWLHNVPLILAGGLTPDNVAEAIRIVRPQAVDVASGVEASPGKKDHVKVRDFVAATRDAFAQI
jgi:phosphoribosylanthranilate isomerase